MARNYTLGKSLNGYKRRSHEFMELNDKIKKLMNDAGLTQKQLADKSKVTEASMSKYLKGTRTPRTDVVVKIAKALGVSVEALIGDSASKSPFSEAQAALARCKSGLTEEDKKKLMKFLLED